MITLRAARMEDRAAIESLIRRSARELSAGFYTAEQVASLLRYVFGVDSQLIRDATYFVAETERRILVAAGGWSRRCTLYGGDVMKGAEDPLLDPGAEAARIVPSSCTPTGRGRVWPGGSSARVSRRLAQPDSDPLPWSPRCRVCRCTARSDSS